MATEIRVPTLGESVSEATIAQWFKKPGEAVKADEPLVELETDKVTVEVPAPASGVLQEILADKDSVVIVGAPLCLLAEGAVAAPQPPAAPVSAAAPAATKAPPPAPAAAPSAPPAMPSARAPWILAICPARDPVAPAAADTTTVSPGFGLPISRRPK